ncbi:Cytidylate kinase [Lachnospiraceae bacterium]|nr:Cytidylate kinase [Lachnospiraceae bacterium]
MSKFYITIARQFGSLGRPIARELSEMLGIEYYDRDIVEEASKKLQLPVSVINSEEEKSVKSSFLNMLFPLGTDSVDKQDKIFDVQKKIITDFAAKDSAIFVGRCADYILKDYENVLNIFIYAPKNERYLNCVNALKMNPKEAKKMMEEVDRAREQYWHRYAGHSSADFESTHLMINSSLFGIHDTAKILADIARDRFL